MISLWAAQRAALESNFTSSLPPLWSFSRASQGTQINGGVLSTVGNNVARFEDTPAAGYLNEPQSTNLIRNAAAAGGVAGQVGVNETMPTNWQRPQYVLGMGNSTSIAWGVENGMLYTDLSVSVVLALVATGYVYIQFDTAIAANISTQFTGSFNHKLVSGALPSGIVVNNVLAFSGGTSNYVAFTPSTSVLASVNTMTCSAGSTLGTLGFQMTLPVGLTYAFTVRIYDPQVENLGLKTSWISTSGTAATRASDNLTFDLTQIPGLQTPSGYGVAMDFSVISNSPGNTLIINASINGDINNQWGIVTDGGGFMRVATAVAGVTQYSAYLATRAVGQTNRLALSITPAGIRWSMNGAAVVGVTNAGQPLMGTLAVGRAAYSATAYSNMHATLVSLSPGPQTDAALIARAY